MKTLQKTEEHSVATLLYKTQREIEPLLKLEKELKETLFKSLKSQKVRSLKLEDGTTYIISERQTLKVKDEDKAWEWAMENPHARLKIDSGAALLVFRKELKLPKFFSKTVSEYLTIKRRGED